MDQLEEGITTSESDYVKALAQSEASTAPKSLYDAIALLSFIPILTMIPPLFEILNLKITSIQFFYPLALASIALYFWGRKSEHFKNLALVAAVISVVSIVIIPSLLIWLYWELQNLALAAAIITTASIGFVPVLLVWFYWGRK